jgi:MtN3 and saliva related transmembrane protein
MVAQEKTIMEFSFITIVGLIAAFLTTSSFLPQSIKVIKSKHTKDLSLGMYILLILGMSFWLFYGILSKDIPIIIANTVSLLFAIPTLVIKLRYG